MKLSIHSRPQRIALRVIVLGLCVLALFAMCKADAQVLPTPTRTSASDWECQDKDGVRISGHNRFDTALFACWNHERGHQIDGGTYRLNRPVTSCPPAPAPATRPGTCPAGTTGAWEQTSSSTAGAPPACDVTTTWAPSSPPEGACVVDVPDLAASTLTGTRVASTSDPTRSNVTLTWTEVAGATSYEIERCNGPSCSNFARLATATVLAYANTFLPGGFTFKYRVRAVEGTRLGPWSNVVEIVTPAAPPPPPTGSATISWEHDGIDLAGFRIYYGQSLDNITGVVDVPNPAARSQVVDGLSPGAWLFYVTAYDAGGAASIPSKTATKVVL